MRGFFFIGRRPLHPALRATFSPQGRRTAPDPDAQSLYLTATKLSELLLGIAILTHGKHGERLDIGARNLVTASFGQRILPFDREAAAIYAGIVARTRAAGHSISVGDGRIAAVAGLHGFAVATRDVAPFEAAGLRVTVPWQGG